jgi:hypothetical protein
LSSQSFTTLSQQPLVGAAVAAGAAAALETPAARSPMETASAASADLVQVCLARIVVLVPAWSRSALRALSAGSSISLSNRGVLAVMPL